MVTHSALKAQTLSKSEAETVMWRYLKDYSPTSFEMMKNLEDRPSSFQLGNTLVKVPEETPPLSWVDEYTDDGIRVSLNTIVHETIHGFTSSWPYVLLQKQPEIKYKFRDNFSAFYVDKDEIYLVKHTKVFNSNEMIKDIPKELQTFRFDPYLTPRDNDLGSQAQGFYGLMDEWNAYYHGTRTAFELFSYYTEKANEDPQVYLEHISDLAGTYFAYYEFKYYMLTYMLYAQEHYPEIYQGIMDNEPLRKAYLSIDQKFSNLINQFQNRLNDFTQQRDSESGSPMASEEKGFYFIGRKGVGLFVEEREVLKKELSKAKFVNMDATMKAGM